MLGSSAHICRLDFSHLLATPGHTAFPLHRPDPAAYISQRGGLGSFSRTLLLLPLAATPRSPLLPLCSSSRAPSHLALRAQTSLWTRTRLPRCRRDAELSACDSSPPFLSPRSLASSSNG